MGGLDRPEDRAGAVAEFAVREGDEKVTMRSVIRFPNSSLILSPVTDTVNPVGSAWRAVATSMFGRGAAPDRGEQQLDRGEVGAAVGIGAGAELIVLLRGFVAVKWPVAVRSTVTERRVFSVMQMTLTRRLRGLALPTVRREETAPAHPRPGLRASQGLQYGGADPQECGQGWLDPAGQFALQGGVELDGHPHVSGVQVSDLGGAGCAPSGSRCNAAR